jgi:hypothetical protein
MVRLSRVGSFTITLDHVNHQIPLTALSHVFGTSFNTQLATCYGQEVDVQVRHEPVSAVYIVSSKGQTRFPSLQNISQVVERTDQTNGTSFKNGHKTYYRVKQLHMVKSMKNYRDDIHQIASMRKRAVHSTSTIPSRRAKQACDKGFQMAF